MGETANTGTGGRGGASNGKGLPPAVSPLPDEFKPSFALEEVNFDKVDFSKPAASSVLPNAPKLQAAPLKPLEEIDKGVGHDIASILQGVKLPSRPEGSAPKGAAPVRKYDTTLSTESAPPDAAARVREAARAVSESLPTSIPSKVDDVRSFHTLKDDLQDVVRTKKISMVRAVALEEEKRHRPSITPEEEAAAARPPMHLPVSLIVTVVLFLVGAMALGATYYVLNDRVAVQQSPLASQVLFAEQAVPFSVGGLAPADVKREIAAARNSSILTLGAIMQVVPVRSPVGDSAEPVPLGFGEFMRAIGAKPPEELLRALSDEFFFGIHTVDENAPVMVIPVTSYERAFAGMLAWERNMNQDLAPMFAALPKQTVGPEGVLVERTFEDTVIRNFDVRILKDESGTIQLYYSFPTRNILIIAESQYSFTEILSRLRADRRL